jgi:hypothetical protein
MLSFVRLSRLIIVTGLLSGAACSRGQLPGGTGGTGGGSAGVNGTSDAGGPPITSCPASLKGTVECRGTFDCTFQTNCTCHSCCSARWSCVGGLFQQTDFNDGCFQGPPCPNDAGPDGSGGVGGSGGTPITSCPASSPMVAPSTVGPACDGTFSCGYRDRCHCGICCQTYYDCENGHLQYFASDDACQMVTCDAGATTDASTRVCTPGADQTCNDNPAVSSIHGTCTDAGTCICNVGAGHNPESGKCL